MRDVLRWIRTVFWLLLSAVSASCATPPPQVRTIPPEVISRAEQDAQLWKDIYVSNELIDAARKSYGAPVTYLSNYFRNDVLAQVEPLDLAIQSKNAAEVGRARVSLEERMDLLSRTRHQVEELTAFLEKVGNRLSPFLKAEVRSALQSAEHSLQGESWDDVRAASSRLATVYLWWIVPVRSFLELDSYINQLGSKLSPRLRQQYDSAVKAMRQALKGNSWEEIAKQWQELPELALYPKAIVGAKENGKRFLEVLNGSEKQDILNALLASDEALKGGSWEQALTQAEQIGEIGNKFGGDYGFPPSAPCLRVLSIDGGGVRGIIPAKILQELERRTGRRTAQLFDIIVGTSTGGILALGLSRPNPHSPNEPLYTAEELVGFYGEKGNKIFPDRPFGKLMGLFGPKYRPEGLEEALKGYLGEQTLLGDALTEVVIPAYAIEERRHVFFSTYHDEGKYLYMWEVARAASAAPTYFPPFRVPVYQRRIYGVQGQPKSYVTLVDGGVFANNPAPYALSIAKKLGYIEPEDPDIPRRPYDSSHPLLLLSIGTGRVPRSTDFEDAWNWGLIGWASPVIDIMFSDPGIEDDAQGLMAFSDYNFRLQPDTLTDLTSSLDDASNSNIQALTKIADAFVASEKTQTQLDKLARLLLRERPAECQHRLSSRAHQ